MQQKKGILITLGASHHTAPIEIREKFSLSDAELTAAYHQLKAVPGVSEVALLSTCNRTEIYAVAADESSINALEQRFCQLQELSSDAFDRYGFRRHNSEAVRHLFAVAAGLDSLVVGETEILGQVKDAYSIAGQRKTVGPLLNRLFQRTFQAAKWVRTHTSIGRG
ncbi:MAG TPA: glutamyl-tRNA reductase, partial [Opitutales bacterium]|nr:glutamyl-tRNA reductase [Opitutales bacterium]